jgi:alpha-L-fucosidase
LIQLLGGKDSLPFEQHPDGLHVRLPAKPVGEYAYVIRIELADSNKPQ